MPGSQNEGFPIPAVNSKNSRIRPDDERKAAAIAGLCHAFLKESGFELTEVGSEYAVYRNGRGHQVTIRGHQWFCKLVSGVELSGVGFIDLSDVIRGG